MEKSNSKAADLTSTPEGKEVYEAVINAQNCLMLALAALSEYQDTTVKALKGERRDNLPAAATQAVEQALESLERLNRLF